MMMVRKLFWIVACLMLASASVAQARNAADIAGDIQHMVGQAFGELRITSIEAVGENVVLRIDGPAGWRNGITADQISTALMEGFCEETSEPFDLGIAMQVESTEAGGDVWRGPLVTHCP